MLRTRLEMFDMALKVVPINGIQDLWIHVSNKLLLWAGEPQRI